MLVIAGLGNPGRDYENTRHNIGFMAIDAIYAQGSFSPWRAKFHALIAEGVIQGRKALLVKPQTYMNNSGQALAAILQFYKLPPASLVVLHDELDLAPAKLRIKTGGSDGGHNGLKSIDTHCGKDYCRIRLGIGHPGPGKELVYQHVMGNFSKAEKIWLEPLLAAIGRNIGLIAKGESNGFMNRIFTETHGSTAGDKPAADTAAAPDKSSKA
ncbi:MAG: aminoacyl-tRNA hydrolase [Candidatus Tokpelaia sp.]|uniref:aminoacyl-tRNA hydrolase n=1 Tax=Candidatus Tokpelaia sp. TaxID=2233777 RepID=UPI00123A450B|nr:aminoacyl-tRNA hydrolase [Candidatus Tokpelaia sp.]KAA6204745.1 MAG: aminoacyl-tRNA hydrolase [Candidatus Tokpelaia sp.]KAA6206141.1 MAG: aminoacyl-tRNA hydrolase [Candidatus Tokpelaia sp.]KAA6405760.1 aminoacyl-tRNA hydrolase [Candidatus Tokpelaia sp.]